MASDVEGTTPNFKPVDTFPLGDGYTLILEPARSYDWFYQRLYWQDPADDKLVRVAEAAVRKNQHRAVRWAKRKMRTHQRARREAAT